MIPSPPASFVRKFLEQFEQKLEEAEEVITKEIRDISNGA